MNVTPMIDVVMCLIVFYLIVGELVVEQREELELAETSVGIEAKELEKAEIGEAIVVNVLRRDGLWEAGAERGGKVVIDGVEMRDIVGLEDAVRRRVRAWRLEHGGHEVSVEVRADREVTYATMRPIVKACALGGEVTVWVTARRSGGSMVEDGGNGG